MATSYRTHRLRRAVWMSVVLPLAVMAPAAVAAMISGGDAFAFWRVWLSTLVPLMAGVVWVEATCDVLNFPELFVIWVGGTAIAIAWGATTLGVDATWPDLIGAANPPARS